MSPASPAWGYDSVQSDGLRVVPLHCLVCATDHQIALPRKGSLVVELACTPCPSCGRTRSMRLAAK